MSTETQPRSTHEVFCELTIAGTSGHTSLEFTKQGVILDWSKTSKNERTMLTDLIEKARKDGFETFTLDDDDQPEKITDALPSVFFNRKGRILLKTDEPPKLKVFAKGLIDSQIENGKLSMEATKDGEWKILRVGDFELKTPTEPAEPKAKKQKVHIASTPRGG